MLGSTAAWTFFRWVCADGGGSSAWRAVEAEESQAGEFLRSAQSEEEGGIKLAKSRDFKNCSKAAVCIPGRNKT